MIAAGVPAIGDLAVEVLHHRGEEGLRGWSVGSGFLVGGAYVLTAAHNVGDGELLVRIGGSERPAVIRLQGDEETADLALLEMITDAGDASARPYVLFGEVDRDAPSFVEECWTVGFPRFKERAASSARQDGRSRPVRSSVQVEGRIPTAENVGRDLLTLLVGHRPTSPAGNAFGQSEWQGMSGASVFAGQVLVGIVAEHHRPEGSSSLTVVPVTAIDRLPAAEDWWRLLRVQRSDLIRLPLADGLYVWTASDFATGRQVTAEAADEDDFEPGELITVAALRQGRLPNLQRNFERLASKFDQWLKPEAWSKIKRGEEPIRVFWIDGDLGPERSKARLACLSRADLRGRTVYDANGNLPQVAKTLGEMLLTARFASPPVISVDLGPNQDADLWAAVKTAMLDARNRFSGRGGGQGRGDDPFPRVVIAGTRDQADAAYQALSGVAHVEPYDLRGILQTRPYSYSGLASMASRTLTDDDVYNRGLPVTARNLVGREEEIELIDLAWTRKETKVASIVAQGGAGKSALVNEWLRRMRDDDYRGAAKVFAWSFYSQGTRENLVSADPFVTAAMSWLGDDSALSLNPRQRGLRLASLIKRHRMLLVLDGMEPIQQPLNAPHVGGQFTDDSVRALLEELARPDDWRGLCLITTRVPMTDLRQFQAGTEDSPDTPTVVHMDLENLTDHDGAVLLRSLSGTTAREREVERAVREVDGHALAITLLGTYIRDVHHGDLAGRFDLERLTVSVGEGGHARRVMASYVRWLELHGQLANLVILSLIGLFDRPAPPEAMEALLADSAMAPFTSDVTTVGDATWNNAVGALREMCLLNKEIPEWPGTLDAHPLVREHFRDQVRSSTPEIWLRGNSALFDYYQHQAPPLPSSSGEMNALYAAVTHGCAAEQYQRVFDDVLLPRVWRDRRTSFATRRLGMTGSDLVALSNYLYPRQWKEIRASSLSRNARVLVLTNAGVRLRQLGRLVDARDCFGAVVGEIGTDAAEPSELDDASYAAAQNCELLVIAGQLIGRGAESDDEAISALVSAKRAIEYADQGQEAYFRMHSRSSLAEVHFMLGDMQAAEELFQEAMSIDRQEKPKPPFMYSQSLFRYGYFLIETGRAADVLSAAAEDPYWGKNGDDSSLLSEAIRLLALGAARRGVIEAGTTDPELLAAAESDLDQCINAFKTAGYSDYTVRGLLERANFYWVRGGAEYYRKSLKDLRDAAIEAERGQMELLLADVLLQRVGCYMSYWRTMTTPERDEIRSKVEADLRKARGIIEEIHYGRRRAMLAGLQNAARDAGVAGPDGP